MIKISLKSISLVALLTSFLFLFPGCAKNTLPSWSKTEYNPKPMPVTTGYLQEQNQVKVISKKLTESECASCFDSNEIAKNYTAIQLSITNKSSESLIFSANDMNIPIENKKKIAQKLYRDTDSRISLVFFNLHFSGPSAAQYAIHEAIKSAETNVKIDYDLSEKVLGQEEAITIKPYHTIEKIILVSKKNEQTELIFTLINELKTEEITFIAPLNEASVNPTQSIKT